MERITSHWMNSNWVNSYPFKHDYLQGYDRILFSSMRKLYFSSIESRENRILTYFFLEKYNSPDPEKIQGKFLVSFSCLLYIIYSLLAIDVSILSLSLSRQFSSREKRRINCVAALHVTPRESTGARKEGMISGHAPTRKYSTTRIRDS